MKYTLALIRHGESTWNNENKFTGWVDCPLSDEGIEEAEDGGKLFREEGFTFDIAYTSVLKRAIKTLWIILEELDLMYIPIVSLSMCTRIHSTRCFLIRLSFLFWYIATGQHMEIERTSLWCVAGSQ